MVRTPAPEMVLELVLMEVAVRRLAEAPVRVLVPVPVRQLAEGLGVAAVVAPSPVEVAQ